MGKDKKQDTSVRKVKDKGVEKKKLKKLLNRTLELRDDETIKHHAKAIRPNKEEQKTNEAKKFRQGPSTSQNPPNGEDDMEWECTEIDVINTIQEIRRDNLLWPKSNSAKVFTSEVPKISHSAYIYLVIDTNIFLSYLEIIKLLIENEEFGSKIQLCVPWMVLQELDLMKTKKENKGKIEILARKAASFILEQSSRNTTFRLQTLDEFRECISLTDEENADDKILQWCLKLKKEVKKSVCLLSNDTIFCTKAAACGLLSYQSSKIIQALPYMLDIIVKPQEVQKTERTPTPGSAKEAPIGNRSPSGKVALAIDYQNDFEVFVAPVLSQVIELEMKKVYDDMWINIVKVKPPWKFLDTLQCFEKHWIAVFSYVYSIDFKFKLEQLLSLWKKLRVTGSEQNKDIENLYETALCILRFIKKTSKEVGASVDTCIRKLKREHLVIDNGQVLNLFTRIWDHINFLCGTLADVTGISHNIIYTRGTCIPSPPEIAEGLQLLGPLFTTIEKAMVRFIEASENKSAPSLQQFSRELSNCLAQAISQLGVKIDCPVIGDALSESLIHFISNPECKQLMANGIEQLRGYSLVLHNVSLKFHSV